MNQLRNLQTFRMVWQYYKTITFVNLPFSGLIGILLKSIPFFMVSFSIFGFVLAILFFHLRYANQYY
ncbi:hypothetical protein, partial [Xanthocytophaga agilis]